MEIVVDSKTWPEIEDHYRGRDAQLPMQKLAATIKSSPYSELIFPMTSMWTLIVARTKAIRMHNQSLWISFDSKTRCFLFEYHESFASKPWSSTCEEEHVDEHFEHLLTRRLRWVRIHKGTSQR